MITLVELAALHERVQARFREVLNLQGAARYEVLGQRYERVAHRKIRPEAEALAADLRALLDAPDDRLRYVATHGATQAAAADPMGSLAYAQLQMQASAMRPKWSPSELLARFAERGIVVVADEDGNLRVTPASALSTADREVLLEHKPAIVAALAQPAVVL